MIKLTDVEFQYARSPFRLEIPELRVETGSTLAIIGPSGSGKTTLLNLIAGVLVPVVGRVEIEGADISSLNEAARRNFRVRRVGLVFQEFELLEHLRVLDNILLPCRITSSLQVSRELRERAQDLARMMGIGDKLRRHVRRLSQGERQRVALCRALLLQPPLLLCDEPTGNLDPFNKEHVLDVLFEYVQQHTTTLVTVTHDHQMLARFDETVDFASFRRPHPTGEGATSA